VAFGNASSRKMRPSFAVTLSTTLQGCIVKDERLLHGEDVVCEVKSGGGDVQLDPRFVITQMRRIVTGLSRLLGPKTDVVRGLRKRVLEEDDVVCEVKSGGGGCSAGPALRKCLAAETHPAGRQ
jgi:hypothetical protein